jgi:hypothetical protein
MAVLGPPMGTLYIRKLANAFTPEATPAYVVPVAALSAIYRFKRRDGGLWVGGTVFVSSSGVSFTPNRLNRLFHNDSEPVNVRAPKTSEMCGGNSVGLRAW